MSSAPFDLFAKSAVDRFAQSGNVGNLRIRSRRFEGWREECHPLGGVIGATSRYVGQSGGGGKSWSALLGDCPCGKESLPQSDNPGAAPACAFAERERARGGRAFRRRALKHLGLGADRARTALQRLRWSAAGSWFRAGAGDMPPGPRYPADRTATIYGPVIDETAAQPAFRSRRTFRLSGGRAMLIGRQPRNESAIFLAPDESRW